MAGIFGVKVKIHDNVKEMDGWPDSTVLLLAP